MHTCKAARDGNDDPTLQNLFIFAEESTPTEVWRARGGLHAYGRGGDREGDSSGGWQGEEIGPVAPFSHIA